MRWANRVRFQQDVNLAVPQRQCEGAGQFTDDIGAIVELGIGLEEQVDVAAFAVIQRPGSKHADPGTIAQHPAGGLAYGLDLFGA